MGGCEFTLHGKIILLTVWKINDMSLSLPGWGRAQRRSMWSTWWRSDSTSNLSLLSLTLAPVLTWFPPLLHFSLLHHYLSCPLVLLSVFSLLLTEAECHTICHGMLLCQSLQDGVFYQSSSWHTLWRCLAWLHWPSAGAHTKKMLYEHKSWYKVNFLIWSLSGMNYILVWPNWWREVDGGEEKKKKQERELVNSVWAGSLSPQSEHGGLSLLVPESAVKCPVEETHGQQPRESQCDQHSHACVRRRGGF